MATESSNKPTEVQVMAAQVRVKADKRLGRTTPAQIKAIAATASSRPRAKHASRAS